MLVAGCGGGGGEDPQKVLQQTFSSAKKVTSGKLDLSLTVNADGAKNVNGPISVSLTGPFQSRGTNQIPKFDFDLKIGAQGQNFTAGAISTGDKGYIKLQGNTYAVSTQVFNSFKQGFQRSQTQQNGTKQNPSFSSLGVNGAKIAGFTHLREYQVHGAQVLVSATALVTNAFDLTFVANT